MVYDSCAIGYQPFHARNCLSGCSSPAGPCVASSSQRNAEQIAERAGLLYDKFVGFVQDLQRASEQVGRARSSIDEALSKLSVGKGNLVGQVEKLEAR